MAYESHFFCKVKDMNKTIIYKPDTAFTVENSKVKLKKYSDELVSLLGNSLTLAHSRGIKEPIENIGCEILDNGPIVNYKKIEVSGRLSYHQKNFQPFKSGSIRFQVKTESNTGYSQQKLVNIKSLAEDFEDYAIGTILSIGDVKTYQDIVITLNLQADLGTQLNDIVSSIQSALGEIDDLTNYSNVLSITSTETDLVFTTTQPNYKIELVPPMSSVGQSCIPLISLFEGVSEQRYFNIPSENITFLSLEGAEDYIYLTHKEDGNIWVNFHGNQEFIVCPWNESSRVWTEYELSFSENMVTCFKNGKLVLARAVSGILREFPETNLVLSGTETDPYSFGQISLFSTIQHTKNYTPFGLITPYFSGGAFIEYHYGSVDLYPDRDIVIEYEGDILLSLYNGAMEVVGPLPPSAFKEAFKNTEIDAYHDLIVKVEIGDNENSSLTSLEVNNGTPTPNSDSTNPVNFNNIFGFIRRSLGYPRVPVELTDDQLLDALNQSVFQYNRYRNYDKKLDVINTSDLDRHPDGSYYLPLGIEEKDIIEILFRPRFSWSWYSGDNSLMANMYMQNLFSGYNLAQSAGDYYINITTQNDLKNIFGSQSGWSVANGRLYLYPRFPGSESMKIGIKYRETISIEEINTNVQIRQLALAYAKITLGNIRSTFGNQIPGGDAMLQLNGNDLIQQGQAERDMYIQEFIKQQPILHFMWT